MAAGFPVRGFEVGLTDRSWREMQLRLRGGAFTLSSSVRSVDANESATVNAERIPRVGIRGGSDAELSKEVNLIRFLAICLMMMVHVPHGYHYATGHIGLSYETVVTFAIEGLSLIASPLLGLVSGYFCVALVGRYGTGGFISKKITTLVFPLVLWNVAFYAMYFALFLASGSRRFTAITEVGIDRFSDSGRCRSTCRCTTWRICSSAA